MILDQRELKRRLVLRLKGIESGKAMIGPGNVQVYVTDLCNLACKFCHLWAPGSAQRPSGKVHLSLERFSKVARDCAQLQVDTVELSGDGEPTLNPEFFEMLKCLEQYSLSVVFFTNGTFPLDRCRDVLRADRILLNIGEADRSSYNELMGNDLFLRVVKNIRELARLRQEFNPNFRIDVVFVETNMNSQSFLKTQELVLKLGANSVRRTFFEVSDHNQHLKIPGQEQKKEIAGEWPPCFHGWFYSAIRLNGNVNVCCHTRELTVGNVYETSFKEVWESQAYARARAAAFSGEKFRDFETCQTCLFTKRNNEIAGQMEMFDRVRKA